MLAVSNLETVYDDVVVALRGVSIEVGEREIVAVLGTNGAGKTTLLRSITGVLGPHEGEVKKGAIAWEGRSLLGLPAHEMVRRGISLVPEGRRIFKELTVEENLRLGAFTVREGGRMRERWEQVLAYFPALAGRRRQLGGLLSGGEQQMLAIGRALMSRPRLLMLDEPSMGLAPLVVDQIFGILARVNREEGVAILLVEQNARRALDLAARAYVLENGIVVAEGPAAELARNEEVREFYLGMSQEGRRSYRQVKSYRRRRRWFA